VARPRRERRSSGLIRVPFVQLCHLEIEGESGPRRAFIVNINILGAYVADEDPPPVGERLRCRFRTPGNDLEVVVDAIVVWINGQQQHPVHSLPRGFGLEFKDVPPESLGRLKGIVRDYVSRQPARR
jgi:hypothetical protein